MSAQRSLFETPKTAQEWADEINLTLREAAGHARTVARCYLELANAPGRGPVELEGRMYSRAALRRMGLKLLEEAEEYAPSA